MDRQPPTSSSDAPTPTENVRHVATSPFTGRYLLIVIGVCVIVAVIVAIAIW